MTKKAIKRNALPLFASKGYEGTSIAEIAKSVSIQKASFYSHFESKERLYIEILTDALAYEEQLFKSIFKETEGPASSRLLTAFDRLVEETESEEELFLHRNYLFPPPVAVDFKKAFLQSEHQSKWQIGKLVEETGLFGQQEKEKFISLFYVLYDGLRMEKKLYPYEEFQIRKAAVRNHLASLLKKEGI